MRRWVAAGALALLGGCGDDGSSESASSFGPLTESGSGTGGTTSSSATGSSQSASGSGETSGSTTDDSSTSGGGTSTTGGPSTSGAPTTGQTDTSSGGAQGSGGAADLADCVGIGAWASCSVYCEAILETCQEGGCGGSTVIYYGDVNACQAQMDGAGSAQGCSDAMQMGGGNSFARCCCA